MDRFDVLSRRAALGVLGAAALPRAFAQEAFPSRTVQLVVPYGPGGSTDVVGRAVAEGLARELGRAAIVVNRPGAGTVIGANSVAGAAPDGHTLLVATPGIWVGSVLYQKTPYQYFDAFTHVSLAGKGPLALSLASKLPVRNLQEFIAHAKARPGELTYADVGAGTTSTLATEYFLQVAGIQARPIPYGGSTAALTDLVGGNIDFFFDGFVSSLPHIQSGRLRGLGVTHGTRMAGAPELATFRELGLPQLELHVLYGLLAPARTPEAVVARLATATERALRNEAVVQQLLGLGIVAQASTPAAFDAIAREDLARWRKVVKV